MSATCLHKSSKEASDCIKCECGEEIQIAPDYEQMGHKIERHALSHREKEPDLNRTEVVFERVQNNLVSQVFRKTLHKNRPRRDSQTELEPSIKRHYLIERLQN